MVVDKVWCEEVRTIVKVNNKPVDKVLLKSYLTNGDGVMIKFGGKAKKLFKEIVEFLAVTDVTIDHQMCLNRFHHKQIKPSVQLTAKKQPINSLNRNLVGANIIYICGCTHVVMETYH